MISRIMSRRPAIGLTPDIEVHGNGPSKANYLLRRSYVESLISTGGAPFIIPYTTDRSVLTVFLERLQGVVITGGDFDVPPHMYGEAPRPGLGETKPERTNFELSVLRLAMEWRMPVLGICGGMQLINVACGGTLMQDIVSEEKPLLRHTQKHERTQPVHPVNVLPETQLARWISPGSLMVNSTHHQAVLRLGDGLVRNAVAPDDLTEGLETSDGRVVGVQWHPEHLIESVPAHMELFRGFISMAREFRLPR